MKSLKIFPTRFNRERGFSIVELLVVIGLIGIVATLGFVISIGAFQRYAFASERDLVVSLIQSARSRAINNVLESTHSLVINGDEYILQSNDGVSENDTTFPRNDEIMVTETEVEFDQLSGNVLQGAGTVDMSRGAQVVTIDINEYGRIDWKYVE